MTSTLVAYASKHGQTEKIARRIETQLSARGHGVKLLDLNTRRRVDLAGFQLVVVGAPMHARGYPRVVQRFLCDAQVELSRVPSAFFAVGLAVMSRSSDGRAATRKIVDAFLAKTGFAPRFVELFAGALQYSRYDPLTRFAMRRIVAKEGGDTDTSHDYEYTDWAAVDHFAAQLAEVLELTFQGAHRPDAASGRGAASEPAVI